MPCYHPMTAYRARSGRSSETKKWPIVFNKSEGYCDMPLTIPCGKCIGCKLERSRQWAIRCVHEADLHPENCFLTLTYNDENACESLVKRDFVLFMKKVRKKYAPKKIRFFHCGEYGQRQCTIEKKPCTACRRCGFTGTSLLGRAHHHTALFNHDFKDRCFWEIRNNIPLYTSKELEALWPYGYSIIGDVTWESAAYIARYCTKKITGENAELNYEGREPEYVTMSRRPGIAAAWYDKYKNDVYNYDQLIVRKGLICKPAKYYDKKYEIDAPRRLLHLKYRREKQQNQLNNTPERLQIREIIKKIKIQKLKRTYESE